MTQSELIRRSTLLKKLALLRSQYEEQENAMAVEAVLDVMDIVTGWTSPHMQIPNET